MTSPRRGAEGGFEALLARAAAWPPTVWRGAAAAWFLLLCVAGTVQQSLVIDGTRYFWMNDDMLVSMRYARNLAEGHGLVFNPGERVEGYTNPLWTLVMAAVHRLPLGTPRRALAILVLNAGLGLVVLALTDRLLRLLEPSPGWARPAALLGLAFSMDLAFWAVKGFETTLLTALFLWAVTGVLADAAGGRLRPLTLVPLALLPLVRSDALVVWAAAAVLALGVRGGRRRTAALLALSLLPGALHLLWRHGYYGEWLPNTYYLRVAGQPHRLELGLRYVLRFAGHYGVALGLTVLGALAVRRARHLWLLAGLGIGLAYAVAVGGDMFAYARFLAHLVPVVIVLAAVSVRDLARRAPLAEAALAFCLIGSLLFGFRTYFLSLLDPTGGWEADNVVTAVLIARHTRPEARVAVFAAGAVPYFGERESLDMLGKTDRELARRPAFLPLAPGHAKFDAGLSLARQPDLVVSMAPLETVAGLGGPRPAPALDAFLALARHPAFVRDYLPNPVPLAYLNAHNAVFAYAHSVEREGLSAWREPRLGRD